MYLVRNWIILGIFAATIISPLNAEDTKPRAIEKKNRIESVSPYDELLVSVTQLPSAIFERRRMVVQVYVVVSHNDDPNKIEAISSGSAVACRSRKNGTLISSAHIMQGLFFEIAKTNRGPLTRDGSDTPRSRPRSDLELLSDIQIYDRSADLLAETTFEQLKKKLVEMNLVSKIYVRGYGAKTMTELIPAHLLAITEPGNPVDLMVLQIDDFTSLQMKAAREPELPEFINPYRAFTTILPLADNADIGEVVYVAGFGGLQPFVEVGPVSARVYDTQIAPKIFSGLNKPYVLRIMPDNGFSGGPVLNAEGSVLGILKGGTRNFSLAVSAADIKDFLKKAKLD